ncbi:hypothetical protein WJX79_003559 [Trebouxia sp. C0005]
MSTPVGHAHQFLKLTQAPDHSCVELICKRGIDVLNDSALNKGTGFSLAERERLGLRGLLPPRVLSVDTQIARELEDYNTGKDFLNPKGGSEVTHDMTRKWKVMQGLQDRNESLFYRILLENFAEMASIVYDPTVGWACLNFHKLYRSPRGMYFSSEDAGQMASMVYNWPAEVVTAIVVTDGSRILGLGDLGINGLGISIGKLDLYVAAAGFEASQTLPCVLDMGTNNMGLRKDPTYMGLDQDRIDGDKFYELVDEFVAAVLGRWPKAVLQFEDFNQQHARPLLDRYRDNYLVFNDDIQGTATVTLAGVYGAMTVQGKEWKEISQQKVLMVGAGSAGTGIAAMLNQAMQKHGLSKEDAVSKVWLTDQDGLITSKRKGMTQVVKGFARQGGDEPEGEKLLESVKRIKPTVIVGVAAAGPLFTEELLKAMGEQCDRPIIFALSNPDEKMECTAEDAQKHTDGKAIFASGVGQPDVKHGSGTIASRQANNMLIYPGLALGAHLGHTGVVSDRMLVAAAEALPPLVPKEDLQRGAVYPTLDNIRGVSKAVAKAVMLCAKQDGHMHNDSAQKAVSKGDAVFDAWVDVQMSKPGYTTAAYAP